MGGLCMRTCGLWCLVLLGSGTGCVTVTAAQSAGVDHFPPRAEVAALIKRSKPFDRSKLVGASISKHSLVGPFPTEAAVTRLAPTTPWHRALAAASPAWAAAVSHDMNCVARAWAHVWLTHQAQPNPSLRRFIATHCGTTDEQPMVSSLHGQVPASMTDDEFEAAWVPEVAKLVAGSASPVLAGLVAVRSGHRSSKPRTSCEVAMGLACW
jgi:hypothetical protein